MTRPDNKPPSPRQGTNRLEALRERAEDSLKAISRRAEARSLDRMDHELHVHQVELEMQNEELRAALAALEASNYYHAELLANCPIGYLTLDEDGQILDANLAAEKLFAFPNLLPGTRLSRFLAKGSRPTLDNTLNGIRRGGRGRQIDLEYAPFSGQASRWLKASLSSLDPRGNAPAMILCALMDITAAKNQEINLRMAKLAMEEEVRSQTVALRSAVEKLNAEIEERRAIEEELRRAKEAAEAASRVKSEFLANMSHEIRTPLTGLLGLLRLLTEAGLEGDQLSVANLALRSGRRLTGLLSDILDLTRVEAGRLDLSAAPFSLREVFKAVSDTLGPACAEKGLELVLDLDPDLPDRLLGDEARIRQILINLAGNAIKFTDAGRVRLEAAPLSPVRADRERIFIAVSDTGVGIPEDKLAHIFEPFVQADQGVSRPFQGAGLGLAIVRRLVELMDGGLAIESESGSGTTVCLGLSLPPAPPERGREAEPEPGAERPSLRVLLVEDERINLFMTKRLLEKLGHRVQTAENGLEALDVLGRQVFDCVLMDIQMPVMDGIEATREIRDPKRFGEKSSVPVIALTAHAMAGDREQFLRLGMSGYVPKPFEIEDLVRALAEVRPMA